MYYKIKFNSRRLLLRRVIFTNYFFKVLQGGVSGLFFIRTVHRQVLLQLLSIKCFILQLNFLHQQYLHHQMLTVNICLFFPLSGGYIPYF